MFYLAARYTIARTNGANETAFITNVLYKYIAYKMRSEEHSWNNILNKHGGEA